MSGVFLINLQTHFMLVLHCYSYTTRLMLRMEYTLQLYENKLFGRIFVPKTKRLQTTQLHDKEHHNL